MINALQLARSAIFVVVFAVVVVVVVDRAMSAPKIERSAPDLSSTSAPAFLSFFGRPLFGSTLEFENRV